MGSSGTDRFSDYSGSHGGDRPGGRGSGAGGAGPAGGQSGLNRCERAIGDTPLEEVARSEYHERHKGVPPTGTAVGVRKKLFGGRVAVETLDGREVVGLLGTEYLYLRTCMEQGWEYTGVVIDSAAGKVPTVRVDLAPTTRHKP